MENTRVKEELKSILNHIPQDWIRLTTHRLDIYNESLAKVQFLEQFEALLEDGKFDQLNTLPTAYDYIRLGHPLSCVLEWGIAKSYSVNAENVISFGSVTMPLMAILRKNLLEGVATRIYHIGELPMQIDIEAMQSVYGFQFEMKAITDVKEIETYNGSVVVLKETNDLFEFDGNTSIDFQINFDQALGSIILIADKCRSYISEVQHVRRRETIAMTPANTLTVLNHFVENATGSDEVFNTEADKISVIQSINQITGANTKAVVASSGLSMQYAIAMGLIDEAKEAYPGKSIRIVVPPNCYGGTNDQARRVAACDASIEVVDLPVDGEHDMVSSIELVLNQIAAEDAVPYIIAEIPTNPRVEVPDMDALKSVLVKERLTKDGNKAIAPVFILDQTFCPNTYFLRDEDILSEANVVAYVSGSKFPSGGLCTAGYCTANSKGEYLMDRIEKHLSIADNEATALQYQILAKQLPSMCDRIASAYKNTRAFVNFIEQELPKAKINFVSEELAQEGFTPSVFSLDLPTKGDTEEEKETYKREQNLNLINRMIEAIPAESKFCVSYGQLKGCYWTIPATSTQGTTKEGDKDYIVRVALSGNMDLEKHQAVFSEFVSSL